MQSRTKRQNSIPHYQQQELLAASFAAEIAAPREALHSSSYLPTSLFSINNYCGGGAMTSAVNSIFTRPTASVQLSSLNTRYPINSFSSSSNFPNTTRVSSNQSLIDGFSTSRANKTPPMAHQYNSTGCPRDLNFLSNYNPNNRCSQAPNNLTHLPGQHRGSNYHHSERPPVSLHALTPELQEHVFNAAKMAMVSGPARKFKYLPNFFQDL